MARPVEVRSSRDKLRNMTMVWLLTHAMMMKVQEMAKYMVCELVGCRIKEKAARQMIVEGGA